MTAERIKMNTKYVWKLQRPADTWSVWCAWMAGEELMGLC